MTYGLDLSRFEIAIILDAIDSGSDCDDCSRNVLVHNLFKYCDLFPWADEETSLVEVIANPIYITCTFSKAEFHALRGLVYAYLQGEEGLGPVEQDLFFKITDLEKEIRRERAEREMPPARQQEASPVVPVVLSS